MCGLCQLQRSPPCPGAPLAAAGFEAGVFSHAVRSGLYGVADVDGDRQVSYAEIAAFVHRASAQIANDRFRPEVLARPPRGTDVILDLRPRRETELRFDGPARAAHYLLEDRQGVRLLDFHGALSAPLYLMRPVGQGPLYLRHIADGTERIVPRTDGPIQVDDLPVAAAHTERRGAAHEAFGRLFALGFDAAAVGSWRRADAEAMVRMERAEGAGEAARQRDTWRRVGGWSAAGLGGAAALAAVLCEISASNFRQGGSPLEAQRSAVDRNRAIDSRNVAALGLSLGAAAALGAGAVLLLWPSRAADGVELEVTHATLGARWHF